MLGWFLKRAVAATSPWRSRGNDSSLRSTPFLAKVQRHCEPPMDCRQRLKVCPLYAPAEMPTVGHRKHDTLADREDTAIRELALRLLTAYYAGAPLPDDLDILHGGFVMDYLNVTTIYRDRQFLAHEQERGVMSLADGASGFKYVSSDEASNGRTVITAVYGCTVETEYVSGGSVHMLIFPEPLMRGDLHAFSFREELKDPQTHVERPLSDFAGQSFETPADTYRQEVTFLGEKTPVIWAYDKLSKVERPGTPEKNELLRFKNGGSLRKEFRHQYGGLCSGIGWRWI